MGSPSDSVSQSPTSTVDPVAAAATSNEPGERVGFLNKVFGVVHRGRDVAKRLKDANRVVYYTVKLALIAGLIYLVFMA